jgi:hypothetical protein
MWLGMHPPQQQPTCPLQHVLLIALTYYGAPDGPSFVPLPAPPPHQQQAAALAWSPWMGMRDRQPLANSFNTMALTPPAVTDWVADSGFSNHTTSDADNLTPAVPPSRPCQLHHRTSSRSQLQLGRPGWARGISSHCLTPSTPWP